MRSDGFHFEAGCGAGYWVAALKHHGFNIEGIEYAHELVDLVHSVHPQLPVRYRDALAIDRPDNHYDSYLSLRQFWVRHPDGYFIRHAQKILSVNPATYRRQVAHTFERDTPRITQELLAVKQTADGLAAQADFLGAATIYETLGTEIFEQSYLYFDEEAGYDDNCEEEGYYPEEEGLEECKREIKLVPFQ